MNPNVDKLPLPIAPSLHNPDNSSEVALTMPEARAEKQMPHESLPPKVSPRKDAQVAPPATSLLTQPPLTDQSQQTTAAPAASMGEDDDVRSFEKQCIAKAKDITRRASNDPYIQTQEIGKVKAEFIKERFGKELKTIEG